MRRLFVDIACKAKLETVLGTIALNFKFDNFYNPIFIEHVEFKSTASFKMKEIFQKVFEEKFKCPTGIVDGVLIQYNPGLKNYLYYMKSLLNIYT